MKYIAIIWNSAYDYKKEIADIIARYGLIHETFEIDLRNDSLHHFIDELYDYPVQEKWRSQYKINALKTYQKRKIVVFVLSISVTKMIFNKKGYLVNQKAQELKDFIRKEFSHVITQNKKEKIYEEDVFHLTDDGKEYHYQKGIIRKYCGKTFVNDFESAKYYDALPNYSQEIYDFLFNHIGLCSSSVVADVGSGTGRVTGELLKRGCTVYAIDPDENMRQLCESKLKESYISTFFSVLGTDTHMNIADHSVDYVISSQAFHRFHPVLFRKECKRVLKDFNHIIIIWYRVDYEDPIIKDMLIAIKKNYALYQTRYQTDEINGSKLEEESNNESVKECFPNLTMKELISKSELSREEFLKLGLSLVLFPITHDMNSVSELLKSSTFHKEEYSSDLNTIFDKYAKNQRLVLSFRVQIHAHLTKK